MMAALTFNELSMLMDHRTSTTKTLRYAFTYKLPQKRLTCLKCEIIICEEKETELMKLQLFFYVNEMN